MTAQYAVPLSRIPYPHPQISDTAEAQAGLGYAPRLLLQEAFQPNSIPDLEGTGISVLACNAHGTIRLHSMEQGPPAVLIQPSDQVGLTPCMEYRYFFTLYTHSPPYTAPPLPVVTFQCHCHCHCHCPCHHLLPHLLLLPLMPLLPRSVLQTSVSGSSVDPV